MYSTSQFHRKYYFGQEEEEMKLCLMKLSVPWYMFNGLKHTAILSHFLTFITGSSSRLLRIRFSADLNHILVSGASLPVHENLSISDMVWNQNTAISTIVGTSSHNKSIFVRVCIGSYGSTSLNVSSYYNYYAICLRSGTTVPLLLLTLCKCMSVENTTTDDVIISKYSTTSISSKKNAWYST